jgi:hypothetical protein
MKFIFVVGYVTLFTMLCAKAVVLLSEGSTTITALLLYGLLWHIMASIYRKWVE